MLTQVDITRFSTYCWSLEAGLNQSKALLDEKEAALQAEKQRTYEVVKQLLNLNAMSAQGIADLFKLSLAEVQAIAEDKPTQH